MNRRNFLKAAGTATAGTLAGMNTPALAQARMEQPGSFVLTQQAEPERMVAVRRIRRPTRSEPNAGHMLCG